MKLKNKLLIIGLLIALIFTLSACSENKAAEQTSAISQSVSQAETTVVEASSSEVAESTSEQLESETTVDSADDMVIRVGALKGPTGFGISKLMDEVNNDTASVTADIQIMPTPDKLVPMIVKGELDFACVPTNLAAVLYNKTEGKVEICAVNTLGVLHLVGTKEDAEKIQSIADLKGMTIQATGKGAVPEYLLEHLIAKNGLEIGKDVTIDYTQSHQELATSLISGETSLAVLPQPFATIAVMKGKDLVDILDLDTEWLTIYKDMPITTGCIIAKKDFLEEHKELADKFLAEYQESINWVNQNPADASLLIEEYGIFPKAKVAEKAIPHCNMVYMDGDMMKDSVSEFLNVLFTANPKSIGGKMPTDDFYKK